MTITTYKQLLEHIWWWSWRMDSIYSLIESPELLWGHFSEFIHTCIVLKLSGCWYKQIYIDEKSSMILISKWNCENVVVHPIKGLVVTWSIMHYILYIHRLLRIHFIYMLYTKRHLHSYYNGFEHRVLWLKIW